MFNGKEKARIAEVEAQKQAVSEDLALERAGREAERARHDDELGAVERKVARLEQKLRDQDALHEMALETKNEERSNVSAQTGVHLREAEKAVKDAERERRKSEGRAEEAREELKRVREILRQIMLGHDFHVMGKKVVHGREPQILWRCVTCSSEDPVQFVAPADFFTRL